MRNIGYREKVRIHYPSCLTKTAVQCELTGGEAEIKVLKKIFSEVNYIFCISHINNNILVKLKPKIKVEYNRENGLNNNNEENST